MILVRDPIDRLRSALTARQGRFDGLGPSDLRAHFARGLYGLQLERIAADFPDEQILVLQYERCVAEPREQISRTYAYLGIDPGFVPDGLDRPVNTARYSPVEFSPEQLEMLRRAYHDDVRRLAQRWPVVDINRWPNFEDLR